MINENELRERIAQLKKKSEENLRTIDKLHLSINEIIQRNIKLRAEIKRVLLKNKIKT